MERPRLASHPKRINHQPGGEVIRRSPASARCAWLVDVENQPDHWIAEYTTELINLLHILGRLITLEPSQARLLEQICSAPTIAADELRSAGSFEKPTSPKRSTSSADESMQMSLIDE